MTGLPGSGKTTFAEKLCKEENAVHLSADILRKKYYGDSSIIGDGNLIFGKLKHFINVNVKAHNNICIDNMSLRRSDRTKLIKFIKICCNDYNIEDVEVICYYMDTPIEICIERDSKRERVAGKEFITSRVENLCIPSYEEKIDKIFIVKSIENNFITNEIKKA
jgi:predicted kinase